MSPDRRICFTVDELTAFIVLLRKELFTEEMPPEAANLSAYLSSLPLRGTRQGLDDRYIDRTKAFLDAPAGEQRVSAARRLVDYATVRVPKTSGGQRTVDTGEAITVTGQSLQMLAPAMGPKVGPFLIGLGEFFETIGTITAIAGQGWRLVEKGFGIEPGYTEERVPAGQITTVGEE